LVQLVAALGQQAFTGVDLVVAFGGDRQQLLKAAAAGTPASTPRS